VKVPEAGKGKVQFRKVVKESERLVRVGVFVVTVVVSGITG